MREAGFTIVELLIVIVIIGILAAITIVAYNGIQQRAKAASISTTLTNTAKAFRLLGTEQGVATWWLDNSFTGSGNPTISQVISATNLKSYLQSAALPDGYTLQYDNDGDTYNGCSLGGTGVKLFAYNVSSDVAQAVDSQIDDGNLSCGKITWNPSDKSLSYYLSNTQSF